VASRQKDSVDASTTSLHVVALPRAPVRDRPPDEKLCKDCGEVVSAAAESCPSCGVRQRAPTQSSVESALDDRFEVRTRSSRRSARRCSPAFGQSADRAPERGLAFVVGSTLASLSALALVGFPFSPGVDP
jgi:hypothetical protein